MHRAPPAPRNHFTTRYRLSAAGALVAAFGLAIAAAAPAAARPGGWGQDRWDGGGRWDGPLDRAPRAGRPVSGPPEGVVNVATFTTEDADDAARLRPGAIAVTGAPTGSGVPGPELGTYSAAVVDQLAQLGYRIDGPDSAATQVTELHVAHETVMPTEVKKPVSGEMAVGVSNRGTAYGLALNVDLSKPKSALISTTLEARIRDKASGRVLWEGRADINTREGDEKWGSGAIAARLAAALFDHFPGRGAAS